MRFYFICGVLSVVLFILSGNRAEAWTHMAHAGETLEQLSVRYYGSSEKTFVIRAANGFIHRDDGRLTDGEPVEIPEIIYLKIGASDTWQTLSNTFLASPTRASFLAVVNGFDESKMPSAGTIIKIPYHLRHIFAANETLKGVISLYYKNSDMEEQIVRYNNPSKTKYVQGDVIIIPLMDLDFTQEERIRVDTFRANRYTLIDTFHQRSAGDLVISLKEDYEKGRYIQMIEKASRLLGHGRLTIPQEIGLNYHLAHAYVALNEPEMALKAFKEALTLQPEMELLPLTTSPKVMSIYKQAKKELDKNRKTKQ